MLEYKTFIQESNDDEIKELLKSKIDLASYVIRYMSLHEIFDMIADCDENKNLILEIMLDMGYDIEFIDNYIDSLHYTKEEMELHNRISKFFYNNMFNTK